MFLQIPQHEIPDPELLEGHHHVCGRQYVDYAVSILHYFIFNPQICFLGKFLSTTAYLGYYGAKGETCSQGFVLYLFLKLVIYQLVCPSRREAFWYGKT